MASLSSSPVAAVIPTKSFYSSRQIPQKLSPTSSKQYGQKSQKTSPSPKHKRRSLSSINTNRGVKHQVRRRHCTPSLKLDTILSNIRNKNLLNRIETNRQTKKVHTILRESVNPIELAKPLRSLNMVDDSNNNNKISERLDDLTEKTDSEEFSDFDSFSDDSEGTSIFQFGVANVARPETPVEDANSRPETPSGNRKFFKSRQTVGIAKQVKITDNIRAIVCNRKITLYSKKRKVPRRPSSAADFSVAQAAVNDIIKNLDISSLSAGKAMKNENNDEKADENPEICSDDALNDIELLNNTDYSDFRKRIPYKTDDPVRTEDQHFLLDFLISHNICNENTFKIFIADPDNHKLEATKIVNEVLSAETTEDEDFRQRIPYNTDDPAIIEQQYNFIEFLISHNVMTEENFDIFIANYDKRRIEANAILASYLNDSDEMNQIIEANAEELVNSNGAPSTTNDQSSKSNTNKISDEKSSLHTNDESSETQTNSKTNGNSIGELQSNDPSQSTPMEIDVAAKDAAENLFPIFYQGRCQPLLKKSTRPNRMWNGGYGPKQYQIDAGQKEFGAKQCKQCGLIYGAHEPEEEKLHRDFHFSLHILRFKGWIDEDRIADYPEWGRDGRIIRVTDSANSKRRERLNEILKIIDKELGFSSYIIPKTFVAYLAVRNFLIVGFCLVQPIEKANKYLNMDGVDCCTIEEFDAKCGISRIWVAPLHRRLHIGKKLIRAVQVNTIMGEEIPLDKIAFSAPTEAGKLFAQKITKTENFLVYH